MTLLPSPLLLPSRTLTGRGKAATLLAEAARFGSHGILVHGASLRTAGRLERVLAGLPPGVRVTCHVHSGGEPTLAQVAELIGAARRPGTHWVAAIGGGSVIDLAKAAAGLVNGSRPLLAYHDGSPLETPGIPFIAAPTTAGTGSEATPNAVLTNEATGCKKSIRDDSFVPRIVVLDAELLAGAPPHVIAHSGLDALTQAVEAFTSRNACAFSDPLALRAVSMIAVALRAVHASPASASADELLAGSYLAGLALAAARLGVVHGIAHPLGARYHQPHGLVCAVCLPHAIELNRAAFGAKYGLLSRAVGSDLMQFVSGLLADLSIRSPFRGQALTDRERMIEETLASGSTAANPKPVTRADVEWLLTKLFEPGTT